MAQAYPTRPVRLVSPFAPGGGTDILGRLLAQRFSEIMGSMIVENRAGAGGNVGAQSVARAEPDGYTLLMAVNSYAINANIHKSVPFDLQRDFAPIGMVATSPFVLVVHPSLPVKTVQELITYARSKPGVLNYGSAGLATAPHLAGELFKLAAGIEMTHVPYQGSGPNVTGQLRGDVQVSAISLNSIEGFIGSDQVRVLAVMSPERSPKLPDVPTVAESGLKDFNVDLWYALLAPRNTPEPIIARLNADLRRALAMPSTQEAMIKAGYFPAPSSPEELATTISRDLARWKDVVERARLRIE
jgi:tripartite-type tricarboxylate transporter receptor subunit TctC